MMTMRAGLLNNYERQARRTEALLLLFVLAILLLGTILLLDIKGRAVPENGSVVIVNTATPAEIARALRMPLAVGQRIAEERRRTGGFADVEALGRLPLVPDPVRAAERLRRAALSPHTATRRQIREALGGLDTPTLERLITLRDASDGASWERLLSTSLLSPTRMRGAEPGMAVRTWGDARRHFLIWVGLLGAFLLAAHLWLRRTRPRADPFLLPIAGLLSVLGVLLLFSMKDPVRDMPSAAAQAQGIVLGGSLVLLVTLSGYFARLPLHRYGYLYAVTALLGTVLLGIFGSGKGGVKLTVAGTQPVEAIKILLVFFLAAYLAERGPLLNDPLRRLGPLPVPRRKDIAPLLVLYALPLVLFALVKDLGPVLLLFGTFLLLVYLATGRGAYVVLGLLALGIGGWVGYELHFGVFETRVEMWLSPWRNSNRGGDQLAHGLWGLASGGAMGSGLGLGRPDFIPRAGSDLIFAALGEELGLIGSLLIVACFIAIIARGLRIARRVGSDFERLLAAGLSGLLALQALIILGGTLGLLPLAGITLPFVGYGKSSLITSFFISGVLLLLSAKTPAASVSPPRVYDIAAARITLVFAVLFAAIVVRLVVLQGPSADRIAGLTQHGPDADGQEREHVNPRLLALARRIPRGRILDRAGRVLAETRSGDRTYPFGAATGHLVGYLDPAVGGPAGLEARHDAVLRGFESWPALVPYWRGKDLGKPLPRGRDVTLALDAELQKAALAALEQGAAGVADRRTGHPKNRGAVVMLDVTTGGVLVAVTLPTYNPARLTPAGLRALRADINGDYPLINRAVGGLYPPGSTFKVVTASALFATGNADLTTRCNHVAFNVLWSVGDKTYARRRIVDDESERSHGLVNLTEAISESCNIFFARAGIALGPASLREQASHFGFARLPSATQFNEELPDIAFGQGPMLATPLEMAGVSQTIAFGGRRLRPVFVKRARGEIVETPLTPDDAGRLAEMMRRVTVSGTAAGRFRGLPYAVAGKTGTAENEEGDRMSHSWFIGFAPVDNPKVAFAVIVENGGYGSAVAAPIARRVLEAANLQP